MKRSRWPERPMFELLWRLSIVSLLANCRSTCPQPVQVEAPRPPAQVTVTPDKTPCNLPADPRPAVLGGVPQGDGLVITQSGLGELARYSAENVAWRNAAKACLEAKP